MKKAADRSPGVPTDLRAPAPRRARAARPRWAVAGLLTLGACSGAAPAETVGSRAEQTIQDALASAEPWVRAETTRLLGVARGRVAPAALRAALDDPHAMVQTAAVEALLRAGDPAVEEVAMTRLVAGTEEQRAQILSAIAASARPTFREAAIRRAMLDLSPVVQVQALDLAQQYELAFSANDLGRLVQHEDLRVADAAFKTLASADAQGAMDTLLRGLRDTAPATRTRALRMARFLPTANVWPMMRSLAAEESDAATRRLALVCLGNLGDPTAEDGLREVVLTGAAPDAADALRALARIPTPRATDQPLVHRRDPRPEVRQAALDELIRQGRPPEDFELFLTDARPDIAEAALLHMQRTNPERAAAVFARTLAESDDPKGALVALLRASLRTDISRFLAVAAPQFEKLLDEPDQELVGLAARLTLAGSAVAERATALSGTDSVDALYAVLEAGVQSSTQLPTLYTEALDHDLTMLRVAGAIGLLATGTATAEASAE